MKTRISCQIIQRHDLALTLQSVFQSEETGSKLTLRKMKPLQNVPKFSRLNRELIRSLAFNVKSMQFSICCALRHMERQALSQKCGKYSCEKICPFFQTVTYCLIWYAFEISEKNSASFVLNCRYNMHFSSLVLFIDELRFPKKY